VVTQLAALSRNEIMAQALHEYGAIVVVPDIEAGVELLNQMAPEHAELLVADPWSWVDKIRHCGALFLGSASTEPVGDYFAGTNHVLPTNGAARYASSLGLADFVKTTSIIAYTDERLQGTGEHIIRMARAEGLEAHARAVSVRQDRRAE
jgi:histidinol dehydrogenase